jgi:hypothetical protein
MLSVVSAELPVVVNPELKPEITNRNGVLSVRQSRQSGPLPQPPDIDEGYKSGYKKGYIPKYLFETCDFV